MLLHAHRRAVAVLLVATLLLIDSTEQAPVCSCSCPSTARRAVGASKQTQAAPRSLCIIGPKHRACVSGVIKNGFPLAEASACTEQHFAASPDLDASSPLGGADSAATEQHVPRAPKPRIDSCVASYDGSGQYMQSLMS